MNLQARKPIRRGKSPEISPQSVQRLSPAKLSNLGEFDTSSSRFVPRACTHKSAPCKRGSVTVRFAPKATELLRCRKTSLCADSWNAAKLFARDHLRKNRCTTPKAGLESGGGGGYLSTGNPPPKIDEAVFVGYRLNIGC